MLHEFLFSNRAALIDRCKAKVAQRSPKASDAVLEHGIPLFLNQLIKTLRVEQTPEPLESRKVSGPGDGAPALSEIGETAAQHGRELLQQGFTVNQVVHVYGDLCQAITDLAFENGAPFETDEFRTLNRCLDNAIAGAVTEFSYQHDSRAADKANQDLNERLGFLAHEMRNLVLKAKLAAMAIKSGRVGVTGPTGSVLDRSLIAMGNLIDRSLADVRVAAGLTTQRQLISLAHLTEEIGIAASLEAQVRGCRLTVSPVDPELAVDADRDLLLSAVGNLLQNAFKFSAKNTEVTLHVYAASDRILIDVEDHCGGLPPGDPEKMFLPFTQAGADRTGVGLGLSIAKHSVEANDGVLRVRNVAGSGCIFTIDLPRRSLPEAVPLSAGASTIPRETEALHGAASGMARILVVEDDNDTRLLLAEVLKRDGYRVDMSADGGHALAAQEQSPFDVVIMDIFMPDADGVETIREFRRIYPQTRIIAMSGDKSSKVDYLSLCLEIGADRILRKPFDLVALQTALKEVLAIH